MKNKQYIIIFLFTLIFFALSCEKEDNLAPTIQFKTTSGYTFEETMVALGDSVIVGILAESNSTVNITNLNVTVNDQVVYDEGYNVVDLEIDFTIYKGLSEEEQWVFTVKDKDGNTTSVSILLTKDPDSGFKPIVSYYSISLGAQENSLVGGFLSFTDHSINDLQTAFNKQSSIDLIYYYEGSDENTIASPGANIDKDVFDDSQGPSYWSISRTTNYLKTSLAVADFEVIQNDSLLIASYNETNAKRKAKNLMKDDIYSFKTEDGKLGLFLVRLITGKEDGTIEIAVKIQE